ncbi:MAG TPA: glycosyltransferase [Acidimicrobiales bacterium]|nr:glycosyltransferase [Acidimicrobiales bacterium]
MRGGTVRYLFDVVAATPGITHHVALPRRVGVAGRSGAVADTRAAERLTACGATVHVVDMRRNPLHPANAAAVAAVGRLIREIEPDVVHGHSSVGGLVARVAARPAGVPAVHTPNGLMTSPPAVAFERILGTATARVIAVSDSEAGRVAAHRLVPASRVVVIPNGISLALPGPAPDVRTRLGLPAGTPLVATVARVARQKAPEQFVRACAALARRRPAVHFLLIGLGPEQHLVDREVAANRLGGRFHQIPHLDDAAAAMGQFDVFLLLSRYEGGPYTPLEAMRAGVPVVLSDVVGNRDTVVDTVTGYLTPFGDAEAAAAAAVVMLDDPDRRAEVVAAARARLRAEFNRDTMGERVADVYRELAAAGGQPPVRRRTRRLPQASSGQSTKRPDDCASR